MPSNLLLSRPQLPPYALDVFGMEMPNLRSQWRSRGRDQQASLNKVAAGVNGREAKEEKGGFRFNMTYTVAFAGNLTRVFGAIDEDTCHWAITTLKELAQAQWKPIFLTYVTVNYFYVAAATTKYLKLFSIV